MGWWKTTTSNVSLDRGLTHQWIARSMPWDLGLARPTVGRCILHHLATYPRWGKLAINLDTMHLYMHFNVFFESLIWCGWGVCVFRDVRSKSFLHEIKCSWVRYTCSGVFWFTCWHVLIHWPFLPGLQTEKGRGVLTFRRALFIIATGRDESAGGRSATGCWGWARFFCVSPPLF